jgi:hypothetical protein
MRSTLSKANRLCAAAEERGVVVVSEPFDRRTRLFGRAHYSMRRAEAAWEHGLQGDSEVAPLVRVWAIAQEGGDATDDRAELVMGERPNQDAPCVVAIGFSPLAQQRHCSAASSST